MRRPRSTDDRGFTLVEVLVVTLLIAILAMIALPAFLGQRPKAQDTEAQGAIRVAQIALSAYETDHDTFNASRADLEKIEPTIGEASVAFDVDGTSDTYTISERSESGTVFTVERDEDGVMTRTCTVPNRGRCGDGSSW
jgi:type IV pilus assembly protein PilA